jgi:hypothetical protein
MAKEFGGVEICAPRHLVEDYAQLAQCVYAMATSWAPTPDTSGCFDYATTSIGAVANYSQLSTLQSVLYRLQRAYTEICENHSV